MGAHTLLCLVCENLLKYNRTYDIIGTHGADRLRLVT
jgi:hypothetical protein